jgi:hypothetical protein
VTREFFLKTTNDVAVVFLPPGPVGLYSEQTQDDMKLAARDTFSEMETVQLAIPPLMGLERVMRFRDEKKVGRADAVAPDIKKAMRNVRRSLDAQGVTSRLVTHEDAISRPDELAQNAPMAIQIVVGDAQKDTSGRQPVYRLKASLSLVDTQTGSALFRQDVTGESQESKAGVVAAFYECLDGAVAQFVSSRDFMAHVSSRKQTASKQ